MNKLNKNLNAARDENFDIYLTEQQKIESEKNDNIRRLRELNAEITMSQANETFIELALDFKEGKKNLLGKS